MGSSDQEINKAVAERKLLASSADNIRELLNQTQDPVVHAAVEELVAEQAWEELNDRFFQKLAFGTGGLRGRTIGRTVTQAEQGTALEGLRPEYPCVGTYAMNFETLGRAVQGMIAYVKDWLISEGREERPRLVFAHDTRHFSRDFAEFAARVGTELGADVHLFESARSTPELSFALRYLKAHSGAMLTASHNPPHDNGFKAYFVDGCQIVEPHASGVVEKVNQIQTSQYTPLPESEQGSLHILGPEIDEAYMRRLETLMLQPSLLERATGLKVVYTNLHGTGGVIIAPMLKRLGFNYLTVPEQDVLDGNFPTVQSPNPENAAALKMAMDLAEAEGADLVIGTDPDADRMGVAVRNREGKLVILTGNQIGSLLAWYRTTTFLNLGFINDENKKNATIIKTFVTTKLQDAIAAKLGISCVNTLTGFKYIGSKLTKYEKAVPLKPGQNYNDLSEEESRQLRLKHSKFFIFGGEESYGYLAGDFIRDKDANAAVVMFCELAAYAKSRDLTVAELMDEIYAEYGYFKEQLQSLNLEGAEGAAKIQKLATSYTQSPPKEVDGSAVVSVMNFADEDYLDEEGDPISREKMILVELADGRSFAVRPSGTEPKIKYYLFSSTLPSGGKTFSASELSEMKERTQQSIDRMWSALERDIETRLGS